MIYEGAALHTDFEKGRKSGNIQIKRGEIVLKDAEGFEYELPIHNLQITQGGAGNRYVYFRNGRNPDLTIYTDDKRILSCDELKNNENLKQSINRIAANRNGLKLAVLAIAFIFIGVLTSFYLFRVKIVEHIAGLVPPSVENSMSDKIKAGILTDKKVISSLLIDSQLALITAPLVNALEDKEFAFTFTIIKDETLNAFALPGGTIIIHSGLIDKAKSPEEVAGVLAHEISHVTKRHHLRSMIGQLGMFTIVRGLLGDVAGVSSDLIAIGASLETMAYSRDFERESDIAGFELLLKAGINPEGMVSFFETMEKENGSIGIANFLSTHPDTKERIEYLKEKLKSVKSGSKMAVDFENFRTEIQLKTKEK